MSLYDILACPTCKVRVVRSPDVLTCTRCARVFPIVNGVPVLFPDGSIPAFRHQAGLQVRDSYDPWVHRVILQSLLDNQIVIEVGAGNMALDDPCIVRMDVTLTPYVDVVGDVHCLPFLPESVDYIFSLAVFEHLRNPFLAARSIYDTLKDGGYIFHDCNFVYAYHGVPHHYFNATLQGLEQVFSDFTCLRKGVATYQMPSFALNSLLQAYLNCSLADQYEHGKHLTAKLRQVLAEDLTQYDIYFSEAEALNVAAGTYFAGVKQKTPGSSVVPDLMQKLWRIEPQVRERFPDLNQIATIDNILTWAKSEGRDLYPEIGQYLTTLPPFSKKGELTSWQRTKIRSLPLVEPQFGAIGFDPNQSLAEHVQIAEGRQRTIVPLSREPPPETAPVADGKLCAPPPPPSLRILLRKGFRVLTSEGPKALLRETLQFLARRLSH